MVAAKKVAQVEREWLATQPAHVRKELAPPSHSDNSNRKKREHKAAAGTDIAPTEGKTSDGLPDLEVVDESALVDDLLIAKETTANLAARWATLPRSERVKRLQTVVIDECEAQWRKRFGKGPWAFAVLGEVVSNRAAKRGKARAMSARTALVMLLDERDYLGVGLRADNTGRFLTVTEKTWASFLVGHWPAKLARIAMPQDIFRRERGAIDRAQARHPLTPLVSYEPHLGGLREHPVRRGKQARNRKRTRPA